MTEELDIRDLGLTDEEKTAIATLSTDQKIAIIRLRASLEKAVPSDFIRLLC